MIVLDTHAWIWWVTESRRLSARALKAVAAADSLGVSVMSCWEVAMLAAKGRIGFTMEVQDWVEQALRRPKVRLLSLQPATAVNAVRLPDTAPDDPIDRLIIAECRCQGAPLVTKDEQIHSSRLVDAVW